MLLLLILLVIITNSVDAQSQDLKGKVLDLQDGKPLFGVNIAILNTNMGTTTNKEGEFFLTGNFEPEDTIEFSYLGYSSSRKNIREFQSGDGIIYLRSKLIQYDKTVVVRGLIAEEGFSPVSFSKIKREEIEKNYTVQDIPEYLSYLPSTTFYSENGNGIGYNYLRIRGFGQRRISISYNGIPQNDPEDHNVYWHNITDLLESTELVQVQRGAGSGIIGYPSIGGAINIITSPFSDKPVFELSASLGSHNTRKYSAKFSSGLVNDKYSVYAKLSKVQSDGYRDNSWVDFNSYHVSAARYDEHLKTVINFYGGPVYDGLAYYGIPKEYIKDRALRKTNILSKNEVEEFSQPHYELLNELSIGRDLTLNSALFLVVGEGYFDYDGSWSIYYDDYFRLKENGYSDSELPANAFIRAQVENKQWGWLPKLSWEHGNGTLIVGGEYRKHSSVHWGAIKYAENIPANLPQDYRYYYYEGSKDILNFFANENYRLTNKLNILGEIQLAYHKYKLFNERYLNTDFSIDGLYLNPRLGLNYKFSNEFNTFASFARVTREPRLKTYYDAAESSGGALPQFELNSDGEYDFERPLVNPEKMNNIELGARYNDGPISLNLNLFYMYFDDEIVSQGQLDRFGQPITGNVENTVHMGIELDGVISLADHLDFVFNASYSSNYIKDGVTYVNAPGASAASEIDLSGNSIAGFPDITMNAILKSSFRGINAQLSAKYVGEYFSDNYDKDLSFLLSRFPGFVSYSDNLVESYVVFNFLASYKYSLNSLFNSAEIFFQINNIFDNLYAAYATGGDFFPAAERNILGGLKLGF